MQIHDSVVSPLYWAVKDGKLDMARVWYHNVHFPFACYYFHLQFILVSNLSCDKCFIKLQIMIRDLLEMRADRDAYYYGYDHLW